MRILSRRVSFKCVPYLTLCCPACPIVQRQTEQRGGIIWEQNGLIYHLHQSLFRHVVKTLCLCSPGEPCSSEQGGSSTGGSRAR